MSTKWQEQPVDALYNSVNDEEMCHQIRQLCYCRVEGVESLLTVIGSSICLEKVVEENSGMTSSARRVTIAGSESDYGCKDGPGSEARFGVISEICVDGDNRVIVCDTYNDCVWMMDLVFPYTVVILCGRRGSLNEEFSKFRMRFCNSVCVDALNNIYICITTPCKIIKIDSKRETIVIFFDNTMVDDLYYGDINLKRYCVLNYPTKIMILDNRNLIIANSGNSSICKVSLYPTNVEGKIFCSVVKYDLKHSNIAIAKSGDIIVCEHKRGGVLEFYKILSNGHEIHIADKGPSNIDDVMQVVIRQQDNCDRLCFFTVEHECNTFMRKIVQTRMNMKWDILRVLFIACFKPNGNTTKTFELLPVIGKSGKYSPILKMIIDFVNTLL